MQASVGEGVEERFERFSLRLLALQHNLNLANILYFDEAETSQRTPTQTRRAAILALDAVIDFLKSVQQPGRGQIPIPIVQLYAALKDVELLDRVHPIFSPIRKAGRPEDSYLDRQIKTYAAAVMTLFMQEKKSKSDASRIVERRISKAGYSLRGVNITGRKVSYWRDRLTGRHGGNPMARVYEQLVSEYSANPRLTAADALDELVSFVNQWNLENPPS